MDEVMQLMLAAQAHDPTDADVKVLLGVLYNVSMDYPQAAVMFREAMGLRPGRSESNLKNLKFLYTGGVLFHVEWCIRLLALVFFYHDM